MRDVASTAAHQQLTVKVVCLLRLNHHAAAGSCATAGAARCSTATGGNGAHAVDGIAHSHVQRTATPRAAVGARC